MDNWSYTMDSESHLTIYRNGTIMWEGIYEAFIVADVTCPPHVARRIHNRAATLSDLESQSSWDDESYAVHG
jgi:hypothetical protein